MKNTLKVLWIIAMSVVIGFCFFACDDGGGDDDSSKNKGGDGYAFPDACKDLLPGKANGRGDNTEGIWADGKGLQITFGQADGKWAATVNIGANINTLKFHDLVEVSADGKTIKVKALGDDLAPTGDPITVCTGWTVTGTKLVLTGGEGDFAEYSGKDLYFGDVPSGDPLHAEWYTDNGTFAILAFTFKANGEVQHSTSAAATYLYEVADGKITSKAKTTNIAMGSAKFVIDGKKMTLSESTGTLFTTYGDGDYYKK